MKNYYFYLHVGYKNILFSPTLWLNNNIEDGKLIFKEVGHQDYQSGLNVQRRGKALFRAVNNEYIQLLNYGFTHLDTLFFYCCDSLKTSLSWMIKKWVNALHKNCVDESIVSFLHSPKQTDWCISGLFAKAFFGEKLSMDDHLGVTKMWKHLVNKRLSPFPNFDYFQYANCFSWTIGTPFWWVIFSMNVFDELYITRCMHHCINQKNRMRKPKDSLKIAA